MSIDRKIDVAAILFLLVQNRQQTHDWTLIGSGTNGLGIEEWNEETNYSLAVIKAEYFPTSVNLKVNLKVI